jgi:sugar lactone lactonase YvrE
VGVIPVLQSTARWKAARRIVMGTAVASLVLAVGFMALPSPVDPAPFKPPNAPSVAPNTRLQRAELLGAGRLNGPEDIALDAQGRIYTGMHDGTICRLHPDGRIETFADTGGRPLGLHFDAAGNLIVCDARNGLLSVTPLGQVRLLTARAGGKALRFTNHLDIAPEGTIYFSDSSDKFTYGQHRLDLLEMRPRGRLLAYEPATGNTRVLLEDLYFANGVALGPEARYVLVNETWAYRIRRYWLKGSRAGTTDVFVENLPGFPDNLSSNPNGRFWVALFTLRNPMLDRIHSSAILKRLLGKLPEGVWGRSRPYGYVVGLDEQGRVVADLQDPTGMRLKEITSAVEHDGYLYFGTLHGRIIGRLQAPE